MKNLHITDSYTYWNPRQMKKKIVRIAYRTYDYVYAEELLNRSYFSMIVEWWLHNIGYYITLPFVKIEAAKRINERCKHVDLEEWK